MTRAKGRRGRAFGYNTTGKNVDPSGGFFAYNTTHHNVAGGPGFLAYDVTAASTGSHLALEEDGTSLFTLEEGGGSLLLEESA